MRRHHIPLIAGLAVALSGSAIAGPGKPRPTQDDVDETFRSFTVTSRARLGVMVLQLTPELREHFGVSKDRGVLVGRVEPDSAAATAGIAVGDVITGVGGESVADATDVIAALAPVKKDDRVAIEVTRDRKPVTLTATMRDEPGRAIRAMRPEGFPTRGWPRWFRDMFDDDTAPPSPPAKGKST